LFALYLKERGKGGERKRIKESVRVRGGENEREKERGKGRERERGVIGLFCRI